MEKLNNQVITPESVLAIIREMSLEVKEMFAVSDAKAEKRNAEFYLSLEKSRAEFDQSLEKSRAEFEKRIAPIAALVNQVSEQVGGWNRGHGLFAEEYFINSMRNGEKKFFGEQFHKVIPNYKYSIDIPNSKTKKEGEFDVIMINCTSAALIEIKFRARKDDVQKLLNKVADFREEFPQYQSLRLYLGMAALTFDKDVDTDCLAEGIAVLKQDGDTVVITDDNLKTF